MTPSVVPIAVRMVTNVWMTSFQIDFLSMFLFFNFPLEVAVRTEKIEAILGEDAVTGVQLAGGEVVPVAGVFVALGVAGSTALARKMGAEVDGNRIVVGPDMMTSIPGLYAAGDCTGGLLQVAKAVYEGAMAGSEAAKALRKGGFYGG